MVGCFFGCKTCLVRVAAFVLLAFLYCGIALEIYVVFYKASLRVILFIHWSYCPKRLLSLDNTANIVVLVGDAQKKQVN